MLARGTLVPRCRAHFPDGLGCQDKLAATAGGIGEPSANDFFGAAGCLFGGAEGIDVGGIDEIHAGISGTIQDTARSRFVSLETEGHGPETQARNVEASTSKFAIEHVKPLKSNERTDATRQPGMAED